MSSSRRPDTLRYSDLSYQPETCGLANRKTRDGKRHVTISDEVDDRINSTVDNLESYNSQLIKENDLLRDQLRLKEENLRLHGIQILADVIHLMDQHHIKCDKHRGRDLSPAPLPTPPRRATADATEHSRNRSLYMGDKKSQVDKQNYSTEEAHRGASRRILPRQSSTRRNSRNQRSPSLDSFELEELIERSASYGPNRPHRGDTYRRDYNSQMEKQAGNCNVNARQHVSMESESDLSDFQLLSNDDRLSSYFTPTEQDQIEKLKKQEHENNFTLENHWNICEHRHLHVAPSNPDNKTENKEQNRRNKMDKNRSYAITSGGQKSFEINKTSMKPDLSVNRAGVGKLNKISQNNSEEINERKGRTKQGAKQYNSISSNKRPKDNLEGRYVYKKETPKEPRGQYRSPRELRKQNGLPKEHRSPKEQHRSPKTQYRSPREIKDHSSLVPAITKFSLLESNHTRLIGEIAFQLDKRILSFVLNGKFNRDCKYKSFYGYTVVNLQQRIIEREKGETRDVMLERYTFLMQTLQSIGYVIPEHGNKAVSYVNKYGVMKQTLEDIKNIIIGLKDAPLLRAIVKRITPADELDDILILLQCLTVLAADDGMPLFIW